MEREVRKGVGNSTDAAAERIPRCSSATSAAVLRAELGMYPTRQTETRESRDGDIK